MEFIIKSSDDNCVIIFDIYAITTEKYNYFRTFDILFKE